MPNPQRSDDDEWERVPSPHAAVATADDDEWEKVAPAKAAKIPSDQEIEAAYPNAGPEMKKALKSGVTPMTAPTAFEKERAPETSEGFLHHGLKVLGGQIGDFAKSSVAPYTEAYRSYKSARAGGNELLPSIAYGGAMGLNALTGDTLGTIQRGLDIPKEYKERREAGYGPVYSAAAPQVAPQVGVNLPSMEHEASLGHTGAVAAEAAVPAAEIAAGYGIHAVPGLSEGISKVPGKVADTLHNPFNIGLSGEEMITKGVRPRARATGWEDAMQSPGVQRSILEYHKESPIASMDQFKDAVPEIKERLWDEKVQPALDRQGARGVDMKPVGQMVRNAITPEMREFHPEKVQALEDLATKLERARTVEEANRLQKYANAQLDSYFNKYPTSRRSAFATNPDTMEWELARRGVRDQLLKTLEDAGETEIGEARKDYGRFTTIEKELERKVNVNARKTTMSLPRILGLVGAAPTAGLSVIAGEVAHHLAQPDVLIRRGIANLRPPEAPAFETPAPFVPPQYAEAANPVRAALPAPAVEAPYRVGEDISGPMSREEMQGNRWVTPAGLLKGPVHGLLPGIGELAPRGEPLALPGAAELAHPEMFPHEPIGIEAPRQVYREPETGRMQRGYKGEMPPRIVGATAEGGPIREPVTPIAAPIRAPEPLSAPGRPTPEGEGLLPRIGGPGREGILGTIGELQKSGVEKLSVGDTFVDETGEPRRIVDIKDGKIETADGTKRTYQDEVGHLGEINSPRAQLARGGKFIPEEERAETSKVKDNLKQSGIDLRENGVGHWVLPDGTGVSTLSKRGISNHWEAAIDAGYLPKETLEHPGNTTAIVNGLLKKNWVRWTGNGSYELWGLNDTNIPNLEDRLRYESHDPIYVDDPKSGTSYEFSKKDFRDNDFNLRETLKGAEKRQYAPGEARDFNLKETSPKGQTTPFSETLYSNRGPEGFGGKPSLKSAFFGEGYYFGRSPEEVQGIATRPNVPMKVLQADVNLKKPLMWDSGLPIQDVQALAQKSLEAAKKMDTVTPEKEAKILSSRTTHELNRNMTGIGDGGLAGHFINQGARALGYDGLVTDGQVVVFDKRAFKSAETPPKGEAAQEGAASPKLDKLVNHINKKDWWHVPPAEGEGAYTNRGKFLASSFKDAEFYGRPLDEAQHVQIKNPLVGTGAEIAEKLGIPEQHADMSLEEIKKHDQEWAKAARENGYDAIVTVSPRQLVTFRETGQIPRNMEVNDLTHMAGPKIAYRAQDVGATEINPRSHAHATESLEEAERYLQSLGREAPEVEVGEETGPRANASGQPGGGGLEEQARMNAEREQGVRYFREDAGGKRTPLIGLGRQDLRAQPGGQVIRVEANGRETVLDARPIARRLTRP